MAWIWSLVYDSWKYTSTPTSTRIQQQDLIQVQMLNGCLSALRQKTAVPYFFLFSEIFETISNRQTTTSVLLNIGRRPEVLLLIDA